MKFCETIESNITTMKFDEFRILRFLSNFSLKHEKTYHN